MKEKKGKRPLPNKNGPQGQSLIQEPKEEDIQKNDTTKPKRYKPALND